MTMARVLTDVVVEVVKACLPFAKVKAGFRESGKELHPLPVGGLGYRLRVEFAGPLEKTLAGNRSFHEMGGTDSTPF